MTNSKIFEGSAQGEKNTSQKYAQSTFLSMTRQGTLKTTAFDIVP